MAEGAGELARVKVVTPFVTVVKAEKTGDDEAKEATGADEDQTGVKHLELIVEVVMMVLVRQTVTTVFMVVMVA